MTHHALYRFYDKHGQLLYVGITNNPGMRWPKHADEKPWWSEVSGITLETYPDRDSVLAAERRAIMVENPRHNKNLRRQQSGKASVKPEPLIVWRCDACGSPVERKTGYIHVSYHDIARHEESWRAFKEKHRTGSGALFYPFSALSELQEEARWRVHHAACDPEPDGNDYWIGVERAATTAAVLDWTVHLMQKAWIRHTNWPEFIRARVLTVHGINA